MRGPGPATPPLPGYALLTCDDYSEEWVPCVVYDHFLVEMTRPPDKWLKDGLMQWWCAEVHADGDKRRAVSDERVEVCGRLLSEIRTEFGTQWPWAFALPAMFKWLLPERAQPARFRGARRGAGANTRSAASQSGNASAVSPDGLGG